MSNDGGVIHPLVEEAVKKAAIAWVSVPGGAAGRAVWCLWIDSALYVVTGPGEQVVPGLYTATEALVTLRGDHGGRIVTWPAAVRQVEPGGEEWSGVVPQLAGKRLNAAGTADELAERWAEECVVVALTPAGEPVEAGTTLPDDSQAAPPRPSIAANPVRRPFHLHRVRRPRA
jgi:hypothetical protein